MSPPSPRFEGGAPACGSARRLPCCGWVRPGSASARTRAGRSSWMTCALRGTRPRRAPPGADERVIRAALPARSTRPARPRRPRAPAHLALLVDGPIRDSPDAAAGPDGRRWPVASIRARLDGPGAAHRPGPAGGRARDDARCSRCRPSRARRRAAGHPGRRLAGPHRPGRRDAARRRGSPGSCTSPHPGRAPRRRGAARSTWWCSRSTGRRPRPAPSADHRRPCPPVVVLREASVLVGPLVRPGLRPCLRCVDLHRAGRTPTGRGGRTARCAEGPARKRPSSAAVGRALAAAQVLAFLDGRPAAPRRRAAMVSSDLRPDWSSPRAPLRCAGSRARTAGAGGPVLTETSPVVVPAVTPGTHPSSSRALVLARPTAAPLARDHTPPMNTSPPQTPQGSWRVRPPRRDTRRGSGTPDTTSSRAPPPPGLGEPQLGVVLTARDERGDQTVELLRRR